MGASRVSDRAEGRAALRPPTRTSALQAGCTATSNFFSNVAFAVFLVFCSA